MSCIYQAYNIQTNSENMEFVKNSYVPISTISKQQTGTIGHHVHKSLTRVNCFDIKYGSNQH
jgi:hypothetical protein